MRQSALNLAYECHPERFVNGQPQVPVLPDTVMINPVSAQDDTGDGEVNIPTLTTVKKKLALLH